VFKTASILTTHQLTISRYNPMHIVACKSTQIAVDLCWGKKALCDVTRRSDQRFAGDGGTPRPWYRPMSSLCLHTRPHQLFAVELIDI
jgi:hypothetical protein